MLSFTYLCLNTLRRRRKRLEACKMVKRGHRKCSCMKCSSYRYVQRKRVLEPDYLANLAYQQRISQNYILPDAANVPESLRTDTETEKNRQDHRDLYITIYFFYLLITWLLFILLKFAYDFDFHSEPPRKHYSNVVWWTDVNYHTLMPPLLNNLPTRSNYSSTSGFRSASPDILGSSETTINTSDGSDSSDFESCRESSSSPRTGGLSLKSEPRVRNCKSRVTRTSRSASMPLGNSPNNEDTSQLASKATDMPSRRKKRPVSSKTTTSHVCDSFSTCVKCAKAATKSCKRFTD